MTPKRSAPIRQRGAAILLAMLIMTLVATLAAGMVWLQWRGIAVESAERARGQGEWLLNGALDWSRLILKSARRATQTEDDLTQPWAMPLAESRLSSFLATDANHSDASGPDAFLSGQITDANSRYNLAALYQPAGKVDKGFLALCEALNVPQEAALKISSGIAQSYSTKTALEDNTDAMKKDDSNSVLLPQRVSDLAWYGVDPAIVKQLEPYVVFLPVATPVNVNTAAAEVLMAGVPGLTRADAQVLIQKRQQGPFTQMADFTKLLPTALTLPQGNPPTAPKYNVDVKSDYFEVYGQLRYEQNVLRERTLVHRPGMQQVDVIRRERLPPDVQ